MSHTYAICCPDCDALDMTGNVREWTADWHSTSCYRSSPRANPAGPARGRYRVTRGGSWYTDKVYARITHRREYSPAFQSDFGFRCAMDE